MDVDQGRCLGETCGCNRLCTRVFKCPGLRWDSATGKAGIDEAICTGCGVCAEICLQQRSKGGGLMVLAKDPFNVIIGGVGGQGNVVASQILGQTLVDKGYVITIGETYGARSGAERS